MESFRLQPLRSREPVLRHEGTPTQHIPADRGIYSGFQRVEHVAADIKSMAEEYRILTERLRDLTSRIKF